MFGHLSIQTREAVFSLCRGESIALGGQTAGPLSMETRTLLALLAAQATNLQKLTGAALVEQVLKLQKDFDFETSKEEEESNSDQKIGGEERQFRIGQLRADSFRGLAPAGQVWNCDFAGRSHLLYGPNGCGKSSLLGAIGWCLTGRFFRDDCEPREPESVKAYPADAASAVVIERDDAQALIDAEGNSSSASEPYWVAAQLLSTNDNNDVSEVWIRRQSDGRLLRSDDGNEWSEVSSIREIGIDEIDAELHLLMPAKISYMRFGKNPDLVHLLAEIVGYGNLETIGEVAENLGRNARTIATNTQTRELQPEKDRIDDHVKEIKNLANEAIKQLPTYSKLCEDSRTRNDIEAFGKTIAERVEVGKAQLAKDLGIDEPEEGTDEYKKYLGRRNNLPGQVNNLLFELEKPLKEVFPISLGLKMLSERELGQLEEKVKAFEQQSATEIEDRLAWAQKVQSDDKAPLMLKAAAYFPDGSNNCPVCTQALDRKLEVKSELEQLRPLSSKEHLHKKIEDHERSLIGRLDAIVSPEQRTESERTLGNRLKDDWVGLKESQCKELLLPIAERFDDGIAQIADEIQWARVERFEIPSEYEGQFVGVYRDYGDALFKAKQYVELCRSVLSNRDTASVRLEYLLRESRVDGEAEALREILERGRATNEELKALSAVHAKTRELWKSAKKVEEFKERIESLTGIANSADPVKELKHSVRREVTNLVSGDLGAQTKRYYELLYDKEVLEFEKLTTGHAGNPDIKDEINLYLRAGQHQVPMGPYSNAGRMRALFLSFAFALLQRNSSSLSLLILDDPALSLDDEHKVRFVDNLVEPAMSDKQVMLGTHYETFFDDCMPVFQGGIQLKMLPRRRACDQIEFEASNLLARVQEALDENRGNWRDIGGNLRIWIEKMLATISQYCPKPFIVFNNLRLSVDNYAEITDAEIATQERDTIVQTLRCRHVQRVIDKLHHNEAVNRPDVEDALRILQQQAKKVIEKEIKRFKGLYQHALSGRGRGQGTGVVLSISPFTENLMYKNLEVVREMAAAHNAEGIEWDANDEYSLGGYPIVLLRSEVISPIALPGQYLVLDWQVKGPESKDLVIVETKDGKRYVRRIWINEDKTIVLESANPTKSLEPVPIIAGECRVRRIVGVLYDNVDIALGGEGEEWVPTSLSNGWFDRVVGVRVHGTSLEPVARNGQIVLVKKTDLRETMVNDMLACVSVRDAGDFIKRCYVKESQCVLCAVNPTEREVPIVVDIGAIQQVYPLKGVLFEVGLGNSVE